MEGDDGNLGGNAGGNGGRAEAEEERREKLMREMFGGCGKRAQIHADGECPKKFRRLENGARVPRDSAPADVAVVQGSDPRGAQLAAIPGRLITVVAYTGTGSAFDWASMHEVVFSDEILGQTTVPVPLNAVVVGVVRKVYIDKHVVLSQIATKLNLRLHEWEIVAEHSGLYRCRIDMDVPFGFAGGVIRRQRFYGKDVDTQREALESACAVAVDFLTGQCDVIVKDVNYKKAKWFQRRYACAENYNALFMDLISEKEKHLEAINAGFLDMVTKGRRLCKGSMDGMPILFVGSDGPFGRSGSCGVVYVGGKPPVTALD